MRTRIVNPGNLKLGFRSLDTSTSPCNTLRFDPLSLSAEIQKYACPELSMKWLSERRAPFSFVAAVPVANDLIRLTRRALVVGPTRRSRRLESEDARVSWS